MGQELGKLSKTDSSTDLQSELDNNEMRRKEIRRVDQEIRRKFKRSNAKYNFRVVIRGPRRAGKTSLLNRLEGAGFIDTESYEPTPQIVSSHINWSNRKNSDDSVLVDVWDVVDKAIKPNPKQLEAFDAMKSKSFDSLTALARAESMMNEASRNLHHADNTNWSQVLDATTVDVYKKANAAVFLFDLTKPESFDYVKKEIFKVPPQIHVVILGNFRDRDDEISISSETIQTYVESFNERIQEETQKREKIVFEPKTPLDSLQTSSQSFENGKETQNNNNDEDINIPDDFWCRPPIQYFECSMKNGFGLKQLFAYFNCVFFEWRIAGVKQQIAQLKQEYKDSEEECDLIFENSTYSDYIRFLRETRLSKQKKSPAAETPKPKNLEASASPAIRVSPEQANGMPRSQSLKNLEIEAENSKKKKNFKEIEINSEDDSNLSVEINPEDELKSVPLDAISISATPTTPTKTTTTTISKEKPILCVLIPKENEIKIEISSRFPEISILKEKEKEIVSKQEAEPKISETLINSKPIGIELISGDGKSIILNIRF